MNTTRQCRIAGDFRAQDLGSDAWALTTGVADGVEIQIGGAESDAAERLRGARLSAATVTWHSDGVSVALSSPEGLRQLKSRTAIIHEPLPGLYGGLPLAVLDERARRFWRRVFWLVRVPGGRRLLGLVARRAGGRARPGRARPGPK